MVLVVGHCLFLVHHEYRTYVPSRMYMGFPYVFREMRLQVHHNIVINLFSCENVFTSIFLLLVFSCSFGRCSGAIPAELGNLSALQMLRLANNKLTGNLSLHAVCQYLHSWASEVLLL